MFKNVYLKDVIERNSIASIEEIEILVDVLASAIGAPTNPSKIEKTSGRSRYCAGNPVFGPRRFEPEPLCSESGNRACRYR